MEMSRSVILAICATAILFLVSCGMQPPANTPQVERVKVTAEPPIIDTPLPTKTSIPTQTNLPPATRMPEPTQAYQPAFGVDYTNPDTYTSQGKQTVIKDMSALAGLLQKQRNNIGAYSPMLGEIYRWEKASFQPFAAGGRTIGTATVEQLMKERRMGGCHDWALVYAAVARELGYPAVIVDTMSIAWAKDYISGKKVSYVGHVFVEVYVDRNWVLVDPTNNWVLGNGYDPANPVIPLKGFIAGQNNEIHGFYVMRKGLDSWDYGIHSNAELQKLMRDTASQVNLSNLKYPGYKFMRFRD